LTFLRGLHTSSESARLVLLRSTYSLVCLLCSKLSLSEKRGGMRNLLFLPRTVEKHLPSNCGDRVSRSNNSEFGDLGDLRIILFLVENVKLQFSEIFSYLTSNRLSRSGSWIPNPLLHSICLVDTLQ